MFREELKPYLNTRVKVVGTYEAQGSAPAIPGRPTIRTALFTEAIVETDDREIQLEHVWVQYAEDICDAKPRKGEVKS